MDERYTDYAVEKALSLLAIDSPTGYTEAVAAEVRKEFENLGFGTELTNKGGVLVDLGGVDDGNGLVIMAHMDTIGAMVCEIKAKAGSDSTSSGDFTQSESKARTYASAPVTAEFTREPSRYPIRRCMSTTISIPRSAPGEVSSASSTRM